MEPLVDSKNLNKTPSQKPRLEINTSSQSIAQKDKKLKVPTLNLKPSSFVPPSAHVNEPFARAHELSNRDLEMEEDELMAHDLHRAADNGDETGQLRDLVEDKFKNYSGQVTHMLNNFQIEMIRQFEI